MSLMTGMISGCFSLLYRQEHVDTTDLNGKYSEEIAARVLRGLREDGWLVKESDETHACYASEKLTTFKTTEVRFDGFEESDGDEQ
ncbi:hypothetical protein NDI76_02180 [Halogeometricum sp. S1BR25-6]|uniref:Uncharacterized protein n=1 Tax=Halogeometricum salsisoli TaxID=2950536 RepID=A0ABU2GBI1_9EURY|nr:hypothetical protein [Halogeometricum sp. S1BR25-6]MDS0297549.1 hypothetical protein [Halogeometricum sp. S1BR25-6]